MVPVWFTQPIWSTATNCCKIKSKRKKDVYLSNDNLADYEENITEPKRKRKQKLITAAPKAATPVSLS